MPLVNNQQGLFSANNGLVTNQAFFDAAFAGRVHADPIFREAYNCNITQLCTMGSWLDEYMGYSTSCYPSYSLIETNSELQQIRNVGAVIVPTASGTVVITLSAQNFFVSGAYVLPQVGNTIVAPNGALLDVVAVSVTAANTGTITVKNRNPAQAAFTIPDGTDMMVLSGSFIADCACPTGNFSFPDIPIVQALSMITVGDKGDLCGDALLKCQYLKIPFTDECGNVYEKWYTGALQEMYKRFELRKYFERLLNPTFGIIPTIKARGMNFVPASVNDITLADVEAWKLQIVQAGISCTEYAIFAGTLQYQQWQQFLQAQGVINLSYTPFKDGDCKWINMEYCGIKIGGLTLHIYEDCTFSNGKLLGGANSLYPNSAIWIPLCDRQTNCRGGGDTKMFTTVYFKDNTGRVWDNLTDSNGVLGPRNTFGTGCNMHEWTIQSRFLQEVHCANMWGYTNLP